MDLKTLRAAMEGIAGVIHLAAASKVVRLRCARPVLDFCMLFPGTSVVHPLSLKFPVLEVLPSLKNSTMATFNVNVNSVGTANVLEVAQQTGTVNWVSSSNGSV